MTQLQLQVRIAVVSLLCGFVQASHALFIPPMLPFNPTDFQECNPIRERYEQAARAAFAESGRYVDMAAKACSFQGCSKSAMAQAAEYSRLAQVANKEGADIGAQGSKVFEQCSARVKEYLAKKQAEEKAREAQVRERENRDRKAAERREPAHQEAKREQGDGDRRIGERREGTEQAQRSTDTQHLHEQEDRDNSHAAGATARQQELIEAQRREALAVAAITATRQGVKKEIADFPKTIAKEAVDSQKALLGENPFLVTVESKKILEGDNPFKVKEEYASKVQAALGRDADDEMLRHGIDAVVPGEDVHDKTVDRIAAVGSEALSATQGSNPLATEVAKQSLNAAAQLQGKVLGQLSDVDKMTGEISAPVGQGKLSNESNSFHGTPLKSFGGVDSGQQGTSSALETLSSSAPTEGTSSPAESLASSDRGGYNYHSDSGATYLIPPGATLYRDVQKGELSVHTLQGPEASLSGDRVVYSNGVRSLVCSQSGIGRVLPECEKKRGAAGVSTAPR